MVFLLMDVETFAAGVSADFLCKETPECKPCWSLLPPRQPVFVTTSGVPPGSDSVFFWIVLLLIFVGHEQVVTRPLPLLMPVDMRDAPLFPSAGWL